MSMSSHVTGYAPPDETWKKMKAVWDACDIANVPIPLAVYDYFGDDPPDPAGITVDLPVREWNGGLDGAGYELDVADIPAKVKTIRFYNSW